MSDTEIPTPTLDEIRLAFTQLTNVLNVLGEADWNALTIEDETPADCAQRAVTIATLAGMLQSCAVAAQSTVMDLMTGMVAAAVADAVEGTA